MYKYNIKFKICSYRAHKSPPTPYSDTDSFHAHPFYVFNTRSNFILWSLHRTPSCLFPPAVPHAPFLSSSGSPRSTLYRFLRPLAVPPSSTCLWLPSRWRAQSRDISVQRASRSTDNLHSAFLKLFKPDLVQDQPMGVLRQAQRRAEAPAYWTCRDYKLAVCRLRRAPEGHVE